MKYKLIIDKNAEEEIIARVHAPSELTRQIENLVRSLSGPDSLMGIGEDDISIKATTTERLGFTGREEGISAYAVVLIEKN